MNSTDIKALNINLKIVESRLDLVTLFSLLNFLLNIILIVIIVEGLV